MDEERLFYQVHFFKRVDKVEAYLFHLDAHRGDNRTISKAVNEDHEDRKHTGYY